MNNLKNKLTSRTFWLTVGTFIVFIANEQYTEAMAVAIAYITGEKVVDTFGTTSSVVYPQVPTSEYIDTSQVVTGKSDVPLFNEQPKE